MNTALTKPKKSRTAVDGKNRAVAPKKRRMAPRDRERLIIEEATRYFADRGFDGSTIELAQRMGITQPLLYRYFPTKQALIERVFDNLFPSRLAPDWEMLIEDDSIALSVRLKTLYKEYASSVLTYEHVRLFLFSGLSKFDYNTRYYDEFTQRIFTRIARALRKELASKRAIAFPKEISPEELELVQSLHGSVYHVGFRRWVYTPPLRGDIDKLIEQKVDWFLDGAVAAYQRFAKPATRGRGAAG